MPSTVIDTRKQWWATGPVLMVCTAEKRKIDEEVITVKYDCLLGEQIAIGVLQGDINSSYSFYGALTLQIPHLSLINTSAISSAGIILLIYSWGISLREISKIHGPIDPDLGLWLQPQCSHHCSSQQRSARKCEVCGWAVSTSSLCGVLIPSIQLPLSSIN